MTRRVGWTAFVMTAIALATPQPLLACAVCFGDPNSPMAIGASWGVLLLIGVTAAVLSAFAGFFFYLVKRSRMALGQRIDLSGSSQGGSSQ